MNKVIEIAQKNPKKKKSINDMLTDFSYMNEPERSNCEKLQKQMVELKKRFDLAWESDELWNLSVKELGNEDEKYCGIYVCKVCGSIFHSDYETSSIHNDVYDFCNFECYEIFKDNY